MDLSFDTLFVAGHPRIAPVVDEQGRVVCSVAFPTAEEARASWASWPREAPSARIALACDGAWVHAHVPVDAAVLAELTTLAWAPKVWMQPGRRPILTTPEGYRAARLELARVLGFAGPVRLSKDRIVEVDGAAWYEGRRTWLGLDGAFAAGVPTLVARVLTPSNAGGLDPHAGAVAALYAEVGVDHLWLVEPNAPDGEPVVTMWMRVDGVWQASGERRAGERLMGPDGEQDLAIDRLRDASERCALAAPIAPQAIPLAALFAIGTRAEVYDGWAPCTVAFARKDTAELAFASWSAEAKAIDPRGQRYRLHRDGHWVSAAVRMRGCELEAAIVAATLALD